MPLEFEWDEDKQKRNYQKHGIRFAEAVTIFADPALVTLFDATHSTQEERYINIGLSNQGRLLIVINTMRGDRIRIISSRLCTPREARFYDAE